MRGASGSAVGRLRVRHGADCFELFQFELFQPRRAPRETRRAIEDHRSHRGKRPPSAATTVIVSDDHSSGRRRPTPQRRRHRRSRCRRWTVLPNERDDRAALLPAQLERALLCAVEERLPSRAHAGLRRGARAAEVDDDCDGRTWPLPIVAKRHRNSSTCPGPQQLISRIFGLE